MNHAVFAPTGADSAHVFSLDHLGVIAVQGDDARSFLQGQLTNDVLALRPAQAQLNGYCSPKGRLLATFINWTDGDTIYLALPLELIEALKKRLSMFVMRAKAKLEITDLRGLGFLGDGARSILQQQFASIPETLWAQQQQSGATLMRVPDANGAPRWICWAKAADNNAFAALSSLTDGDAAWWRWLDIRAGLPWITAGTQEKFVPQMVNLEALGGVNFKKGCYPGQEIVARSQYLGKLKRRTSLAHAECGDVPLPGSDVFGADGAPVGVVVNAEAAPQGGVDLLIELALADRAVLSLAPGGAELQLLELPYELPDNEVFVRPKL